MHKKIKIKRFFDSQRLTGTNFTSNSSSFCTISPRATNSFGQDTSGRISLLFSFFLSFSVPVLVSPPPEPAQISLPWPTITIYIKWNSGTFAVEANCSSFSFVSSRFSLHFILSFFIFFLISFLRSIILRLISHWHQFLMPYRQKKKEIKIIQSSAMGIELEQKIPFFYSFLFIHIYIYVYLIWQEIFRVFFYILLVKKIYIYKRNKI